MRTLRDKPVAKEFIKFSRRLLQALHALTQVAHVGGAVVEPKWVSDVDILLNVCVHEFCVDVKTALLEVVRIRDT
jgi:hypothetical protein